MAGFNWLKNIIKSVGENNKATYAVIAIATVKGICRPMFTMMDKKENPETKKYTALREGLTEVIAIPVYLACGELAAKFGKHIVSKSMDDKFERDSKKGKVYTDKQKLAMKTEAIKKGQKSLMFLGVCTAALLVIPGTCSLVIKPIMSKMGIKNPQNSKENTKDNSLNTKINYIAPIKRPSIQTFTGRAYGGMKVGGL